MAGLPDQVYTHKLLPIPGDYRTDAPVQILKGVGPGAAAKLLELGISTIRELLDFTGNFSSAGLSKIRESAVAEYHVAVSRRK